MKNLTSWILALVAIGAAAGLSGAWTEVQDPIPGKPEKIQGKPGKGARAEKQAAVRKVMPGLKTSLVEGIALAEKETTGKAWSATVEVVAGKPSIQVSLFVGEKNTVARIDPETKKVTVTGKKEGDAKEGDEGGEGETEDGG